MGSWNYASAVRLCLNCEFYSKSPCNLDDAFLEKLYIGVVVPLEEDLNNT